jgi:hypothetical protein
MKWNHSSAVESEVWESLNRVVASLRSDVGQVRRLTPEVDLDLTATHRDIVKLLMLEMSASEFMNAAINLGERQTNATGWDAFRDLSYETELEKGSSFFLEVVDREPPAKPLTGFGVEIAYPSHDGETTADLWLTGGSEYRPNDETWLDVQEYSPRDNAARSDVLATIYRLAYTPGGLGNAADYTLCLAWAAYLSRVCARRYLRISRRETVGLRVGFGGGDWIDFGWLNST